MPQGPSETTESRNRLQRCIFRGPGQASQSPREAPKKVRRTSERGPTKLRENPKTPRRNDHEGPWSFHALSKQYRTALYKPQQVLQSDSRRPSEPRNEVNFGTARSKNSTLACAATIAFGDMLGRHDGLGETTTRARQGFHALGKK